MTLKEIRIDCLTRVEGEGALHVTWNGNVIEDVKLKIFEPPRFFESILRGKPATESPDITARICGICPVAYQMTAVGAVENALGLQPNPVASIMRNLLYCGEWIESHCLHMFLLHAPDFLGYPNAMLMAKDYPELVKSGLAIKKAGNAIVRLIGGREVHPINVKVGGFYRYPHKDELIQLAALLNDAYQQFMGVTEKLCALSLKKLERDYEFVSLDNGEDYPIFGDRIVSSCGLNISVENFEDEFEEIQVPYSNALQSRLRSRGFYLCGPLARFWLHYEKLPQECKRLANKLNIAGGTRNPYESIHVRAVEVLFALINALNCIEKLKHYSEQDEPELAFTKTRGCSATEAPRGLLYHRYEIEGNGNISEAKIVPPTSQNQAAIEEDLKIFLPNELNKTDQEIQDFCEKIIRNHDPCISCATHFLRISHQGKKPQLEMEFGKNADG